MLLLRRVEVAALKGHKKVVELLIAEGADVNAEIASGGSNENKTPLDFAVMKKQPENRRPPSQTRRHDG